MNFIINSVLRWGERQNRRKKLKWINKQKNKKKKRKKEKKKNIFPKRRFARERHAGTTYQAALFIDC